MVKPSWLGQIKQLDNDGKSCNLLKSSEQIKGFNGSQRLRLRKRQRKRQRHR